TPALRGGARPALARDFRGPAHHRDRGRQGDRGGARQGPAPRSQDRGRQRGSGRGRSGVTLGSISKRKPGRCAGLFVRAVIRSEAKHSRASLATLDCFVALRAPRNDAAHSTMIFTWSPALGGLAAVRPLSTRKRSSGRSGTTMWRAISAAPPSIVTIFRRSD